MKPSTLAALSAGILSGLSLSITAWASPSLTPVGSGGVIVLSTFNCASIPRLPCAGGMIKRSGILYSDSEKRAWIAVLPALSDADVARSSTTELQWGDRHVALRRVSSDFAYNLDLYEVIAPTDNSELAKLPKIATRTKFDPTETNILSARMPSGAQAVKLIATDSDRTFLPLVPAVLEVIATTPSPIGNWFGTSVYASTDGALVGLVGDEFLQLRPGRPTRLIQYLDHPLSPVNHVIVVPEDTIRSAAARLAGGALPFILRTDENCYLAAGVRACELCDVKPEGEAPSSVGFPIGGGNGTGVGGVLSSGKRCKMQFSKGRAGATAELGDSARAWFKSIASLADPSQVEAWYSSDMLGSVWILTSAAEFFRTVIDPVLATPPLRTFVRNPYSPAKAMGEIYESADRVAALAFARLGDPHAATGEVVFDFVAQIYTRARVLQSNAPNLKKEVSVLKAIRDSHDAEWWLITDSSENGGPLAKEFANLTALVEKAL